jgi:ribonuclease-3
MDYAPLQRELGYRFAQPALLLQALTHRSHSAPHNERLEFLGDSVLNCCIAHELYLRYGDLKEGELSRLRANLVKQDALAAVAQDLDLGTYLRLGEGELKSGGFRRPSILADTLEALLGAVFLDGGFTAAHAAIVGLYAPLLGQIDPSTSGKDPKTLLQELTQSRKIALPQYAVVATQGAAHKQMFEVECQIPQLSVRTTGRGFSRRVAEQEAARLAFAQLGGQ